MDLRQTNRGCNKEVLNSILTIDIAHPPLAGPEAEAMLDESLKRIKLSPTLRVLKIIHGYGSKGRGGSLKTLVKNWAYQRRNKIRISINGEDIDPFDQQTQMLASQCSFSITNDLGSATEGVTIIWVK